MRSDIGIQTGYQRRGLPGAGNAPKDEGCRKHGDFFTSKPFLRTRRREHNSTTRIAAQIRPHPKTTEVSPQNLDASAHGSRRVPGIRSDELSSGDSSRPCIRLAVLRTVMSRATLELLVTFGAHVGDKELHRIQCLVVERTDLIVEMRTRRQS